MYFPIVHNEADMGSVGAGFSLACEKKYGRVDWRNHVEQVRKSWNRVGDLVNREFKMSTSRVRIYQDGLPVAGEIGLKIVKDVAKQGSQNYQIVEGLIGQGALLEEAESKELLLQEHGYLSRIGGATTTIELTKADLLYKEVAEELLNERDAYIAGRINETLGKGELGMAFFGGKHSIVGKLEKDIVVDVVEEFRDGISVGLMGL